MSDKINTMELNNLNKYFSSISNVRVSLTDIYNKIEDLRKDLGDEMILVDDRIKEIKKLSIKKIENNEFINLLLNRYGIYIGKMSWGDIECLRDDLTNFLENGNYKKDIK